MVPAAENDVGHHPNCYQNTGVPDDMPAGICDCRVLRMIDAAETPCEHTWDYSNTPGVDICTTCGDFRDWPKGMD